MYLTEIFSSTMVIPDHESRIVAGQEVTEAPLVGVHNNEDLASPMDDSDEELKLPDTISLFLVVLGNVLLQVRARLYL